MVEVLCQVGDNRHCEEQSDEAIHSYFAATLIASRSLPSGAHSRDPLARNDVECCGCLKCEDERIDAAPTRAGSSPRELPLSPCVLGRGADVDGSCFLKVDTALILLASTETDGHA